MIENPIRSANKLKLGAFALNGDTNRRTIPRSHYIFNWPNSLDVAEQADRGGFEVVVPFARWRSIASPTHFGGAVFEATAWASAVAARTQRCAIMSTIHVTTMHPMMAAKMMTTIDHVSGGRFALNIVCGWFEEEMHMFGQELMPHDQRYAYADEWITAIKRLWTEDQPFDFEGEHIRFRQGISLPKPIQKPWPVLMNAGGSPAGRSFVAKHCEIALVHAETDEILRREVEGYRRFARETSGRELQLWIPCAVIQGDTMAAAQALADEYVACADPEQMAAAFADGGRYGGGVVDAEALAERKRRFAMGGAAHLIIGDADHIAADMQRLSDAGVDGLLLTWVEPQSGIRGVCEKVQPRLVERGLRQP